MSVKNSSRQCTFVCSLEISVLSKVNLNFDLILLSSHVRLVRIWKPLRVVLLAGNDIEEEGGACLLEAMQQRDEGTTSVLTPCR